MVDPYVALLLFIVSFFSSLILTAIIIPRLKKEGIVGLDMNKGGKTECAEMGGIALVAGATFAILTAVGYYTFFSQDFNVTVIIASLLTILIVSFIGIIDDLINVEHLPKALLPILASIPLVALNISQSTSITIPFFGAVDFGVLYVVVLIPIGIAVASNLTNMFAGFNGLECSLSSMIFLTIAVISFSNGMPESFILSVSMFGAILGFFVFNIYPSKIFLGDVGTLSLGAAMATAVIVGNIEAAGMLLVVPYVIDFFIKALNGFPTTKWWGKLRRGKLYPVEGKVRGFAQLIMKLFNGISEKNLVVFFILFELMFVFITLYLFL